MIPEIADLRLVSSGRQSFDNTRHFGAFICTIIKCCHGICSCEYHRNYLLTPKVHSQQYPERRHSRREAFQPFLERFTTAVSIDLPNCKRNLNILLEDNWSQSVQENPQSNTHEIYNTLGVEKSSVHRILQKHKYSSELFLDDCKKIMLLIKQRDKTIFNIFYDVCR